jgi:cell division septum initiation protein DivIVA
MFSRKNRAERTAAQAWDYLLSAMTAAGGSARDVGKHTAEAASTKASELAGKAGKTSAKLADKAGKTSAKLADKAGSKVNSVTDEAWTRANAAANALAGRKPPMPWRLLVGFGLIGVALGWVAATAARAALERQAEKEELELTETAVVVTPTYDT